MRPYVKICGVTRPDDARLAISLGATHIGVVRAPSSPRNVSVSLAREVFEAVRVETVLVCKDIPIDQVIEDAVASGARGVQLYVAEERDVEAAESAGLRVYRVFGMEEDSRRIPRLDPSPTEARPAVLDVGGGGSGRRFDWTLLDGKTPDATFIAGGVRPENVRELLRHEPYGIDLSSGVESAPGLKDAAKLRALFEEVL